MKTALTGVANSTAGPVRTAAAPGIGSTARPANPPSHEQIAALAYSYWEARGRQGGSAEEDWLRAERKLRGR